MTKAEAYACRAKIERAATKLSDVEALTASPNGLEVVINGI